MRLAMYSVPLDRATRAYSKRKLYKPLFQFQPQVFLQKTIGSSLLELSGCWEEWKLQGFSKIRISSLLSTFHSALLGNRLSLLIALYCSLSSAFSLLLLCSALRSDLCSAVCSALCFKLLYVLPCSLLSALFLSISRDIYLPLYSL